MFLPSIHSRNSHHESPLSPALKFIALSLTIVILFMVHQTAHAADISLQWDANTESDLAGYRVFVRTAGGSYDYNNPDWEGTTTTCTITDLDYYSDYYFVVRAFDDAGNESDDSAEEYYQAPGENTAPQQMPEEIKRSPKEIRST